MSLARTDTSVHLYRGVSIDAHSLPTVENMIVRFRDTDGGILPASVTLFMPADVAVRLVEELSAELERRKG